MSNISLKEQLQALSIVLPSSGEKSLGQTKKKPQPQPTSKQKPQWLEQAQYGVELLKTYFPYCFKSIKEVKPLKIGIKQDLVKHLSTINEIVVSDKACMVSSLAYYVNSPAYHKSVVEGAVRIDLEGNPAGVVTTEEANYSIERRKTKVKSKSLT